MSDELDLGEAPIDGLEMFGDRKKFLANRLRYIGGTDAGAIMGINPYRGPWDTFREKTGKSESQELGPAMEWGIRLESPVAQAYADKHGVRLAKGKFTIHPSFPWAAGTPDRLVLNKDNCVIYGLEIKTAGREDRWGPPGSDVFPAEYNCQCRWYMAIAGLKRWDLAVLIGGRDFRVYTLERDEAYEKEVFGRCEKFYKEHILTGIPPEMDGSRSAADYLTSQHSSPEKSAFLEAEYGDQRLADRYHELSENIDNNTEELNLIKNKLRSRIGDKEGIRGKTWKISWTPARGRTLVDWEQMSKEIAGAKITPSVIAKYTRQGEGYRSLRVSWKGKY